jgi:hypothetical protein
MNATIMSFAGFDSYEELVEFMANFHDPSFGKLKRKVETKQKGTEWAIIEVVAEGGKIEKGIGLFFCWSNRGKWRYICPTLEQLKAIVNIYSPLYQKLQNTYFKTDDLLVPKRQNKSETKQIRVLSEMYSEEVKQE